jgi:hypothetical protein
MISAITPAKSAWYSIPYSVLVHPSKEDQTKTSLIAKTLSIHSEISSSYTLDGELYQPTGHDVTVNLGPKLKFLVV